MAKERELTTEEMFRELVAALTAVQHKEAGLSGDTLAQILEANSKAMQKAMKPENQDHPGLSVFSHKDGDQKRPKPAMPFECYYNGYPVHKFPETESWAEWELFSQLKPGVFTVIRKDASVMEVKVHGESDALGKVTKLKVEFPILRAEKGLVPPKTVLLYQLIHNENPQKAFLEAMQAHIASLFPEPAAV